MVAERVASCKLEGVTRKPGEALRKKSRSSLPAEARCLRFSNHLHIDHRSVSAPHAVPVTAYATVSNSVEMWQSLAMPQALLPVKGGGQTQVPATHEPTPSHRSAAVWVVLEQGKSLVDMVPVSHPLQIDRVAPRAARQKEKAR